MTDTERSSERRTHTQALRSLARSRRSSCSPTPIVSSAAPSSRSPWSTCASKAARHRPPPDRSAVHAPVEPQGAGGEIVEVDASDLTASAVREGIARSGCLLVRGLVQSRARRPARGGHRRRARRERRRRRRRPIRSIPRGTARGPSKTALAPVEKVSRKITACPRFAVGRALAADAVRGLRARRRTRSWDR